MRLRSRLRALVLLATVLDLPVLAPIVRGLTGAPRVEQLDVDGVPVEVVKPAGEGPWPAWLFVNGYYLLFLRISQGASRLQEVLADRWAAFTYGSENFVEGLKHVIRRSIDFDRHAEATVKELATSKAGLANLYRHVPEREAEEQPLDAALEEALTREPTPYDSHPSPKERIELVRSLGADSRPSSGDAPPVLAWSLFPNRDELERVLTAEFCSNVYESTGLELGRAS